MSADNSLRPSTPPAPPPSSGDPDDPVFHFTTEEYVENRILKFVNGRGQEVTRIVQVPAVRMLLNGLPFNPAPMPLLAVEPVRSAGN